MGAADVRTAVGESGSDNPLQTRGEMLPLHVVEQRYIAWVLEKVGGNKTRRRYPSDQSIDHLAAREAGQDVSWPLLIGLIVLSLLAVGTLVCFMGPLLLLRTHGATRARPIRRPSRMQCSPSSRLKQASRRPRALRHSGPAAEWLAVASEGTIVVTDVFERLESDDFTAGRAAGTAYPAPRAHCDRDRRTCPRRRALRSSLDGVVRMDAAAIAGTTSTRRPRL